MTEENEKDYEKNNSCRFCEKDIISDKVRDQCQLTRKCGGPAHGKCNINVTPKQRNFIPFVFHKISNHGCHLFFRKLVN